MRTNLALVLMVFGLVGCATPVSYDGYILKPEDSAMSSSSEGFGPFKEALESLAQIYKVDQMEQHVHITPTVPMSKEKAFRDCYGLLPDDEPIFALVDSAISMSNSGKGCIGFVFTSKGIHSNPGVFAEKSGKSFIPYSTLYSYSTKFSPQNFGVNINNNAQLQKPINMEATKLLSVLYTARMKSRDTSSEPFTLPSAELQLSKISENFLTFSNDAKEEGIYISGSIPPSKEKSFRRCANLDESIDIYILIDATFFGAGSCVGMAYLDTGVIINNSFMHLYPGTYFLSYDYLLNSDFVPYLCDRDNCSLRDAWSLYLDKNVSFSLSGMTGDSMEIGEGLLNMFKQLKNVDSVTNEEAILLAATYTKLPNYGARAIASSARRNESYTGKSSKASNKRTDSSQENSGKTSESFFYSLLKKIAVGVAEEIVKQAVEEAVGIKRCTPDVKVTHKIKTIPSYNFNSGNWGSQVRIKVKTVQNNCL